MARRDGVQDCLVLRPDSTWDDRNCVTTQYGICTLPVNLCSNGVFDPNVGETGVDCGGDFCDPCPANEVTYVA